MKLLFQSVLLLTATSVISSQSSIRGRGSSSRSLLVTDIQAEDATLVGSVSVKTGRGSEDGRFVDFLKASGDAISWTVQSLGGSAQLEIRYALGASFNPARTMALRINNEADQAITFEPTGSWLTWEYATAAVNLGSGSNQIQLLAVGESGPNVDSIRVTEIPSLFEVTKEAEDADNLNRAVVAALHTGWSGDGYVDFTAPTGFATWSFASPSSGLKELSIRYTFVLAGNSQTPRVMTLEVNGETVDSNLGFSPTDSWSNWESIKRKVRLVAGLNTIKLIATGDSGPNVDSVTVRNSNGSQLTVVNDMFAPGAEDVFSFMNKGHTNTRTIELRNDLGGTVVIDSIETTGRQFVMSNPAQATGMSLTDGQTIQVPVQFIERTRGVFEGSLLVRSTSLQGGSQQVRLRGLWNSLSPSDEPNIDEILDVFSFATSPDSDLTTLSDINFRGVPTLIDEDASVVINGQREQAYYFEVADKSQPATILQIGAFHGGPSTAFLAVNAYDYNADQGDVRTTAAYTGATTILGYVHTATDFKSILPRINGGSSSTMGSFSTTKPFTFNVDRWESDPGLQQGVQAVRILELFDQKTGERLVNMYAITMDYAPVNYDYNDNVHIVTNVKPFEG